jgi:hypothetical protein
MVSNQQLPANFGFMVIPALGMLLLPSVRKNAAHKESSGEKSHIQEQSLMAGLNRQAGRGMMAQHRLWGRRGFYRRGRLKKLAHAR